MVLLLPSQLLATKTYCVNVVNNQISGLQRPRRTQADISFGAVILWYKSKVDELNRENMDLFKDNMILSKKNMELEKGNICLQNKLMKLKVIEKKEIDMFMVRVMFGIVLVSIFIYFIIT
ncbi:unnamed protein product [Lactuca virosa]|uniref:Coiled-coil domain-containing protein 167 n=1 Tax=Lactuca virosa TaxID=75947 RepID=A0AAU9LT70_9ASTR|nr:unnamed protein product [Lactuca virosa]